MTDELTKHIDDEETQLLDLELTILRHFRLDIAERSAIRQDAGQTKAEADRKALREITEWFNDLAT